MYCKFNILLDGNSITKTFYYCLYNRPNIPMELFLFFIFFITMMILGNKTINHQKPKNTSSTLIGRSRVAFLTWWVKMAKISLSPWPDQPCSVSCGLLGLTHPTNSDKDIFSLPHPVIPQMFLFIIILFLEKHKYGYTKCLIFLCNEWLHSTITKLLPLLKTWINSIILLYFRIVSN